MDIMWVCRAKERVNVVIVPPILLRYCPPPRVVSAKVNNPTHPTPEILRQDGRLSPVCHRKRRCCCDRAAECHQE